jgi:hypothetical protein
MKAAGDNAAGIKLDIMRTHPDVLKRRIEHLCRVIRRQQQHGPMVKVVLYPCHCGRLTIDEWYERKTSYWKDKSVVEVADLEEARAVYRHILGILRESHYIPGSDTYTSKDGQDNFIVTGSHCTCKKHREDRDA